MIPRPRVRGLCQRFENILAHLLLQVRLLAYKHNPQAAVPSAVPGICAQALLCECYTVDPIIDVGIDQCVEFLNCVASLCSRFQGRHKTVKLLSDVCPRDVSRTEFSTLTQSAERMAQTYACQQKLCENPESLEPRRLVKPELHRFVAAAAQGRDQASCPPDQTHSAAIHRCIFITCICTCMYVYSTQHITSHYTPCTASHYIVFHYAPSYMHCTALHHTAPHRTRPDQTD